LRGALLTFGRGVHTAFTLRINKTFLKKNARLLIHPYIINLIHKGSAKVNVIVKCLVLVKMYGNSPRELLNRINENNEMKINILPGIQ
jgi:hypothetical protein